MPSRLMVTFERLASELFLRYLEGKRFDLFKEMVGTCFKMEQLLATLETLADEETLRAIEESLKQVAKGEFVECSINDLEKVLK